MDLPTETRISSCALYDAAGQLAYKYGTQMPYTQDGMQFVGLPKNNSDFGGGRTPGYHLSTLIIENLGDGATNLSEKAYLQTFFTGVDSNGNAVANYPNASTNKAPDGSVIPNWYYYYNQVYASTGSHDSTATVSHADPTSPYNIHIGNDIVSHVTPSDTTVATALQNVGYTTTEAVFILVNPSDTKKSSFVRFAGYLSLPGVLDYIYICAHEKGHQTADTDGTIRLPAQSSDMDPISDDWENHHHMNSASPDTSAPAPGSVGAYGTAGANGLLPGGDSPDEELVADTSGDVSEVFAHLANYSQDWAIGGVQYGKPYYLQPDPLTKAAPNGFYLWFTPAMGGNAGNLGTSYHVKSLDDIKTQHPDFGSYPNMQVITSWTQMYNATPQ